MAEKKTNIKEDAFNVANGTENGGGKPRFEVGSKEWYNELVPVELFYDGIKYKDPVEVSVNGVTIKVPRGKNVMIKRKFALVLEKSQKQDNYAAAVMSKFEAEAENAKDAL